MTAAFRQWIKEYVAAKVSAIVRASTVSRSTASGDGDKVDGHITFEDEAPGGYDYTVRRLWPFGIRSRPPVGVDAVVVHAFGGSTNGVMVGAESSVYGPSDLQEGEVAIYAKKADAMIKIDVDGKITIDSHSGANVVVNGGSKSVARVDDLTNPGALIISQVGVAPNITLTLSYTDATGVVTALGSWATTAASGTGVAASMVGKITSGASRFKG